MKEIDKKKEQNIEDYYFNFLKEGSEIESKNLFFSQEGEDMMIKRILKKKYYEEGFYIDVGAHHPVEYSNTFHFYLKGWRGINIDPKPGMKELFDKYRPEDKNIELAVSDLKGSLQFTTFEESAYTTCNEGMVERLKSEEFDINPIGKFSAKTIRLDNIIDKYVTEDMSRFAFLSIDVEGHEINVLRSNNWSIYRPFIVICEDILGEYENIENSKIYQHMKCVGYKLITKLSNSLVFCDLIKGFYPNIPMKRVHVLSNKMDRLKKDYSSEIKIYEKQIHDLNDSLKDKENDIQQLKYHNENKINEIINDYENRIAILQQKVKQEQNKFNNINHTLESIKTDIKKELKNHENKNQFLSKEISDLNKRNNSIEKENQMLKLENNNLEQAKKNLENQIKFYEVKIDSSDVKKDALEIEFEKLSKLVKKYEDEIVSLNNQIQLMDNKIKLLIEEKNELKEQLNFQVNKIKSISGLINDYENEKKILQQENEISNSKIETLTLEKNEINQKQNLLEKELKDTNQRLNKLKIDKYNLIRHIKYLESSKSYKLGQALTFPLRKIIDRNE